MPECCNAVKERVSALFDNWESTEKRNLFASVSSGILFAVGWWIMIDAAAIYTDKNQLLDAYHTCGVFGTVAMFMVNVVSNVQIRGDGLDGGCMGGYGARIWFFLGLMMSFGSLIAACWILFDGYVVADAPRSPLYPGIAVFLQNFFIFLASCMYKFGRVEDSSW